MRRLLYIPIIHDEADMGSAGQALKLGSAALSGERRWTAHNEAVRRFWRSVAGYLHSLDLTRMKVYQDGLAADGAVGRRIVQEAARRGSKNYRVVLELLERGAQLRKTEDPVLLLRERENILRLMQQPSTGEQPVRSQKCRQERDRLMEERDAFIAETINATLKEGELGVLFIGADHSVTSRLARDISVETVRSREKVQAYLDELLLGHDDRRLKELAEYLCAPVGAS